MPAPLRKRLFLAMQRGDVRVLELAHGALGVQRIAVVSVVTSSCLSLIFPFASKCPGQAGTQTKIRAGRSLGE